MLNNKISFVIKMHTLKTKEWSDIRDEIISQFKIATKKIELENLENITLKDLMHNFDENDERNSFKWKLSIIKKIINDMNADKSEIISRTISFLFFIKEDLENKLENELRNIVIEKKEFSIKKEYKEYTERKFERLYWFIGFSVPVILQFMALIWSGNIISNEKKQKCCTSNGNWEYTWQIILVIFFVFIFTIIFLIIFVLIIKNIQKTKINNKNNLDK